MSLNIDKDKAIRAALAAAKAGQSALNGDMGDAVAHALDAALALVPAEDLEPFLTAASIRQAKIAKAAGDLAKFGPDGQGSWPSF